MSLGTRSFALIAKIVFVAALAAATVSSAAPQASRARDSLTLREGQEITFTQPQFKVEALWFKANDETGWYWTGSDEVYAVFSDMQPGHADNLTSTYGNVDEGDLVNFRPAERCMAPQSMPPAPRCARGTAELNLRYSFWEEDGPIPAGLEFCPGWFGDSHFVLENGKCGSDDLIGWGAIVQSQADLVAMLPDIGASREFTIVMDDHAGKYRFRYRITRLPNAERSIVIHLPDDLGTMPPSITLSATAATNPSRAVLSWSGASTTTVDVYRNGLKFVTTANDGAYDDTRPPGAYQYRLCDLGSTTACSAVVSVVVT